MTLESGIYKGWVRHRRFSPKKNDFKYSVFMMYLDLAELTDIWAKSPLWSDKSWALAKFKRSDFHGDPSTPLEESVKQSVAKKLGWRPDGPVRMLANLRYFGYVMNPICVYYCFNAKGDKVEAILTEVNNTPWDQKHAYVIEAKGKKDCAARFDKEFHVSPFNPMDMQYRWYSDTPDESIHVHLENWQEEAKVMDATLQLLREPITARTLNHTIIRYPFMTVKVIVSIYWQALKLWFKKVPYVAPPNSDGKVTDADVENLEKAK